MQLLILGTAQNRGKINACVVLCFVRLIPRCMLFTFVQRAVRRILVWKISSSFTVQPVVSIVNVTIKLDSTYCSSIKSDLRYQICAFSAICGQSFFALEAPRVHSPSTLINTRVICMQVTTLDPSPSPRPHQPWVAS